MQISSLLLLTSSFEGMPNVVMEAQAMGLPVVASNVGGVPDCMIDGETGYLVDRDDIGGFAHRCIELLKDDQLRIRFGANGAGYMRSSFSRRAMAERYLKFFWMRRYAFGGTGSTAGGNGLMSALKVLRQRSAQIEGQRRSRMQEALGIMLGALAALLVVSCTRQ